MLKKNKKRQTGCVNVSEVFYQYQFNKYSSKKYLNLLIKTLIPKECFYGFNKKVYRVCKNLFGLHINYSLYG